MTIEEVIEDHPDLERDDLLAALEFGRLRYERLLRVSSTVWRYSAPGG